MHSSGNLFLFKDVALPPILEGFRTFPYGPTKTSNGSPLCKGMTVYVGSVSLVEYVDTIESGNDIISGCDLYRKSSDVPSMVSSSEYGCL